MTRFYGLLRVDELVLAATAFWIMVLRAGSGLTVDFVSIAKSFVNDLYAWSYIVLVLGLLTLGYSMIFFPNRSYRLPNDFRKKAFLFLRDMAPIAGLGFVYYSLAGDTVLAGLLGMPDATGFLASLEEAVFGVQLTVFLSGLSTGLLTDYFSFIYMAYPFLIIFCPIYLWFKSERGLFRRYVVTMVLASCIAFVFFMVLPAKSPQYVLEFESPVSGGFLTRHFQDTMSAIRSSGNDCCLFPSLHVALSSIPWLYIRRAQPKLDIVFGFLAVSEWVSTVYLRRHFGVDVLGGLALCIFCYWLAQRFDEDSLG